MYNGREDSLTKLKYIVWSIIILTICYCLAYYYTIYYWEYWQLEVYHRIIWRSWEIGILGIFIFTAFYLVDLDNLWFQANWFHKFMISWFFGWFLADLDQFILFLKGGFNF